MHVYALNFARRIDHERTTGNDIDDGRHNELVAQHKEACTTWHDVAKARVGDTRPRTAYKNNNNNEICRIRDKGFCRVDLVRFRWVRCTASEWAVGGNRGRKIHNYDAEPSTMETQRLTSHCINRNGILIVLSLLPTNRRRHFLVSKTIENNEDVGCDEVTWRIERSKERPNWTTEEPIESLDNGQLTDVETDSKMACLHRNFVVRFIRLYIAFELNGAFKEGDEESRNTDESRIYWVG